MKNLLFNMYLRAVFLTCALFFVLPYFSWAVPALSVQAQLACSQLCTSSAQCGSGMTCTNLCCVSSTSCAGRGTVTANSPSGTVNPGSYTFSFTQVTGARGYGVYIDDHINGWAGGTTGACGGSINPGDICGSSQYGAPWGPFTLQAGHTYTWWARAKDSCGNFGGYVAKNITVPAAGTPSCRVSGPTSVYFNGVYNYSATASDVGSIITKVGLYWTPTASQSWITLYEGAGSSISRTAQFPKAGTYYVVCNAWDAAGKQCTGNPWGTPAPWISCGAASRITVTASCVPQGGTCGSLAGQPTCCGGLNCVSNGSNYTCVLPPTPTRTPTPAPTRTPTPVPPSAINCSNVSGPTQVGVFQTVQYRANFTSALSSFQGAIICKSGTQFNTCTSSSYQNIAGTLGSLTENIQFTAPGTYTIYCNAVKNNGCTGLPGAPLSPGWTYCSGPTTRITVSVGQNTPTPTRTPTPRPATPTPTRIPTRTPTPRPATPTPTRIPTRTPTPRPATPTPTRIPTRTPTPGPGTPTATPIPTFTISGAVFLDTNRNGTKDSGESNYNSSVTIQLSGDDTGTDTTSGGTYSFPNIAPGNYTLTIAVPASYGNTSTNPQSTTITNANRTVNFGIAPVYTISGNVFIDTNSNNRKDSGESNYTGSISINTTSGTVTRNNGSFTIAAVFAGNQTISYQSFPSGYTMTYPRNGPPPSFSVTVGPGCTVDTTTGAACTSGGISNLNFAIAAAASWVQSIGLNMRFDTGLNNQVPPSPACGSGPYTSTNGSSATPGIIFTGDGTSNFGFGQASQRNWIVGGTTYPEVYKSSSTSLPSSYSRLLSKLQKSGTQITDIQSVCNRSNCTLPSPLPSVIHSSGDLTLQAYTFPSNQNTIILIDGTLTIRGNLLVPPGSTVVFSTSRDIVIDRSVGFSPSCIPGNNRLEGIYSADRNIIVDGINDCTVGADRMLRFQGSVILNAALQNGVFQNNRNLCAANAQYPSVTFAERLDFILNAPDILRQKSFTYQEIAP